MKTSAHSKLRTLPGRSVLSQVALSALMLLGFSGVQKALAQKHALTNTWSMAPTTGTTSFMNTTNHLTRGLTYNPATGHVLAVSRTPTLTETNAIYVLDGTTGAILGTLPFDPAVISGGNFVINMAGVSPDGVIYVCNLTTDAGANAFKLYRWANESAQPTVAYTGDPSFGTAGTTSQRRFGDSLAVRGTGANTQILLGSMNQTYLALLTTGDGVNFNAAKITTDGEASDTRWGLTWGAGDTFWAKQSGKNLKNYTLNIAAGTASVTTTVPLSAVTGGPLDVDLDRNLVAIIDTTNHKLRVYDISNPAAPIQTDLTKDMPAANANGNFVGAVFMKNGLLFALETNNGIRAYTVHEVVYPPGISTQPASVNLWETAASYTFTVGVTGTGPLTYQWQYESDDIPGATTPTLTIPEATIAQEGYYRVIVGNSSGSVTSTPALLTTTPGNPSAQMTNIWNILPDTRPYLTSIPGYREYGVAINPLTKNVIVVTRLNPTNMIAVMDIETGAHKHYIDYSYVTLAGGMNKVDVADDGTIYICNQTTTANPPFTIYAIGNDSPSTFDQWIAFQGNPGNDTVGITNGWGANIAVRGGGMNTEILVGAGKWISGSVPLNVRAVAILKPDPNYAFSSTVVTITNAPLNVFRFSLDWGPGTNTFWVKAPGNLMLVEYDLAAGTGFVKKTYPTTGSRSVPYSVTSINYDPASDLLIGVQNGSPPSPVSVPVYDVSDIDAGPLWVDQEMFTTYNADIEWSGSADLEAGYVVALGVNNGLKAFKVNSGFVSSLPVIVTQPVGGEWFVGTSPTLSVISDSATPLGYQWYFNGTQAIAGATTASLTLTNIQENQAGDYFVRVSNAGGARDSRPATLTLLPLNNTAQMTNIWSAIAGSRPYLNTGYFDYGMSFNPVNSNLLVASWGSTNAPTTMIAVMDALTGMHRHYLDISAITVGGNRWVNKIGVADDGVVYVGNRSTSPSTSPFVVYRWANDDAATIATEAFKGDPFLTMYPNKLAGWVMDVRGSGASTEILVSTYDTNVLCVLKTTDGTNFTANEFVVAGAPNRFARLGICFGAGNTFWAKTWEGDPGGGLLRLVQYDLSARTGTILRTYTTDQVASTMTTVAYNDSLKFLAGIARDDQKNVQVYTVADLDLGPKLLDQELFPTYNASIEANGALDFGGNTYLFALNENNGVMAFMIDATYQPPTTTFKILSATKEGANVTIAWEARSGVSYQVQYVDSQGQTWQDLGTPVTTNGPTAIYTDTVAPGNRFYRVRAN